MVGSVGPAVGGGRGLVGGWVAGRVGEWMGWYGPVGVFIQPERVCVPAE